MARIFIATSFDPVNHARADVVSTILRVQGHEPIVGEDMHGASISAEIRSMIESSKGVIAILSRRQEMKNEQWATHPWVIEEATWASAKEIKLLPIVEEGVLLGGIHGDIEKIYFPPGQFEISIPRIISFVGQITSIEKNKPTICPVEKRNTYSVLPAEPIEECWGEKVKKLIEDSREYASLELFSEAFEAAHKASEIDRTCWRAFVNQGVALVHMHEYKKAEKLFDYTLSTFSSEQSVIAKVLHNKAWLIGARDGFGDKASLRKRKELYMQSLALDSRRLFTRAMVLICMVLLDEQEEARPFIEASMKWKGFCDALKEELEALGGVGIQAIQHFPDWLKNVLYPSEGLKPGGVNHET